MINHLIVTGMLMQMPCMLVWVAMPNRESHLMIGMALTMPNKGNT